MGTDVTTAAATAVPAKEPGIIECHSLVRVYDSPTGRVQAVRGADLSIGRGRAVAIVGPSGSGKSSLLRMISGLDEPTAGEVFIDGVNITKLPPRQRRVARARLLSHVYQRPSDNLLEHLTIHEQVARVARNRGATADAVANLLDDLDLRDRADHRPNQLSGGEQQRAAFARAAIGDPRLIIADEPTGELDAVNTERVLTAVDAMTDRGITVLLATHDPIVLAHIDEIVLLRDGAIASVTDRTGEFAVIDGAGRLQLPLAARAAFADGRVRLRWDDESARLVVERP